MDPFDVLKFCPKCGKSEFELKNPHMQKCQNCGYEMYKNPTIGAAAIVLDDKNRLMLMRRAKDPAKGTLDVPGGFCEIHEKIEEALIREVKEETNIDVEVEHFLFDIPNDYIYHGLDMFPLDFFFKCRIKDMSNVIVDKSENSELLFLALEDINIEDVGLASIRRALTKLKQTGL